MRTEFLTGYAGSCGAFLILVEGIEEGQVEVMKGESRRVIVRAVRVPTWVLVYMEQKRHEPTICILSVELFFKRVVHFETSTVWSVSVHSTPVLMLESIGSTW